jgi:hypothetical protein
MTTLTPTAFADTSTLTDALYPHLLQGGTSSQLNKVWEISLNGQAASSSSPTFMLLSRDTIVAATNSTSAGQTDQALDSATAALAAPALVGTTNTTKPQRSATGHLANCSLNAFGGVYFWRANRAEECFTLVGNTSPLGEVSVSAFTGGTPGAIGSHVIYESL